jgi:hypothetical protein
MTRSSFFGLAASAALDQLSGVFRRDALTARSKVHKRGGLRSGKSLAKKP